MAMIHTDKLHSTPLREKAYTILRAGLDAIDTEAIIRKEIIRTEDLLIISGETFLLSEIENIYVVGIGKCAQSACCAIDIMLDGLITDGVVIDIRQSCVLQNIRVYQGTHPLPSDNNVSFTDEIIALLKKATEKDLVICVVSGGGSTLLCHPDKHTCTEETRLLQMLFQAGASIKEINIVRKHLSRARGGYLAKYSYPSKMVALIFSDVSDNDMQCIASGPTVRDTTTIEDARAVLHTYDSGSVSGITEDMLIETPKEEKYFSHVKNTIVVSNIHALKAMEAQAQKEGFSVQVCEACLEGEARDIGVTLASTLKKSESPTALLYGGETTVSVQGIGVGGRNQEVALGALSTLPENALILSFASDGTDGDSPFAGAVVDAETKKHMHEAGIEPDGFLNENNSSAFFGKTKDGIPAEKTGVNVSDLIIALLD